jgi:hypothetical protein
LLHNVLRSGADDLAAVYALQVDAWFAGSARWLQQARSPVRGLRGQAAG